MDTSMDFEQFIRYMRIRVTDPPLNFPSQDFDVYRTSMNFNDIKKMYSDYCRRLGDPPRGTYLSASPGTRLAEPRSLSS